MALSLSCDCGARFEVEDTLAGQTVACPECQAPIKAPAGQRPPLRTSTFALASVICALVGAFTVVGTVAAVVCGAIAVVTILRQRDRLAGLGFATFGIIAGALFTGLTLLAFTKADSFGMGNWARAQALAPIVDTTGPPEITRPAYAIIRPAEYWGVLNATPRDPILRALDNKADLVLADIRRYAFIDVKVDSLKAPQTPLDYQQKMLDELKPQHKPWDLANDDGSTTAITRAVVTTSDEIGPATKPGFTEREAVFEIGSGRQAWTMLVHLYKKGTKIYVVRCYAMKNTYKVIEPDFRRALDSFAPK